MSNETNFGVRRDDMRTPIPAGKILNEFNTIKVGNKKLDDEGITVSYPTVAKRYERNRYLRPIKREDVEKNLVTGNVKELRQLSEVYFKKSGIYFRLCRYMAYLYRYDLFVTPVVYDQSLYTSKKDKIIEGWYKSCRYLENSNLKRTFGDIALKVIKRGCFYGYKLVGKDGCYIQELPIDYCRSRYQINGQPAVELNVKFFDECYPDPSYRLRVVKLFPKEIQKAYIAYKKGTLPQDFSGDELGWVLLDSSCAVKFNLGGSDIPFFASTIPHLIDLEEAQAIDRKKMAQQIMKIIIQKFPMNKTGNDPVFTIDEMNAFHQNAVHMLGDAVGVDVLSTLADVSVEDMADTGNESAADQLEKVERSVYNEAGVASAMFNTDGNLALEKSVLNDESGMFDLVLQFQNYAQSLLEPYNKSAKKLMYVVQILPTTEYNHENLSKMYKEQTTIGFSKLLPQVALGHSQSSIIAIAYFENKLMNLDEVFVAPRMSSTMSSSSSSSSGNTNNNNDDQTTTVKADTGEEVGRPEKSDDEKSDKTIQNRESM